MFPLVGKIVGNSFFESLEIVMKGSIPVSDRQDPPLALCTKDTLPELPSGTDTLLHQQHPQALPSNLAKYFLTSRFV